MSSSARLVSQKLSQTPLAMVRRDSDPRIIETLLSVGAPLDFAAALAAEKFDVAGRMLADDPARLKPGGADERALASAVLRRAPAAVRWLLDRGADPCAKVVIWEKPIAPIHLAVAVGDPLIVRLLINAGADLSLRDEEFHSTPAGWADHFARAEIIALFPR
jgi:hypothetical protein